jgi:hypothetical protein
LLFEPQVPFIPVHIEDREEPWKEAEKDQELEVEEDGEENC